MFGCGGAAEPGAVGAEVPVKDFSEDGVFDGGAKLRGAVAGGVGERLAELVDDEPSCLGKGGTDLGTAWVGVEE